MTTATKKAPKAKKPAAVKKEKETKAKKAEPTAAAEHETLEEARRIARTIRGLRHEEEGLKDELKEKQARIRTLTDEQNNLLLDENTGQQRLALHADDAPAKNGKAAKVEEPAESGLVAIVDGHTLTIMPTPDGLVATHAKDNTAEHVGVYDSVAIAQKDLLDAIGWHGNAPEWRPLSSPDPKPAKETS